MPTNAQKNKFTIYRGASAILRFTVDPTTIPVADPASGWTTKYTLRKSPTQADPYDLQVSGSWNATTSTIDVPITRAQSLTLTARGYAGALFRTNSGSEDELSRDEVTVAESIYDAP